MNSAFELVPSATGLMFAAAAIAIGAPLFSGGLRALRLARAFRGLTECTLARAAGGVAHVRGRVVLESPMFAPLSGAPCAGYRLEISGGQGAVSSALEDFRPFRIADGDRVARVNTEDLRCDLGRTTSRDVRADEGLSEKLAMLMERVPEARWLRRCGGTLTLTERVLAAGAECHVVGSLLQLREVTATAETEWLATGTDGGAVASIAASTTAATAEPGYQIDSGEHLGFLLISDRAPDPGRFRLSPWSVAGIVVGPALSLAGLIYFARVADHLRSIGSF